MNKILFSDNIFINGDKSFPIEDTMDMDFYEYNDTVADDFKTDMCMVNDMYTAVIQPVLAIEKYFRDNKVEQVEIDTSSCDYTPTGMVMAAANKAGIEVKINRVAYGMKGFVDCVKTVAFFFASAGFIFLKCVCAKYTGSPNTDYDTFSVVNLKQEYSKFGFLRENKGILFDYESMTSDLISIEEVKQNGTVYNRFGFFQKLGWLFKGMANGFSLLRGIKYHLTEKLDYCAAKAVRSRYAKRIVHTSFYAEMLDSYFSLFPGKIFITGKHFNRYSSIEAATAKKYGITIINYPHGLEYGFKMPQAPVGDKFYAMSAHTAELFNKLYETDRFVFSNDVMDAMLNKHYEKKGGKQVIFFSEAHEPDVNLGIVEKLCRVFDKHGIKLVLKLHPKENISFYKPVMDKIRHETDFNEAITGNICIARRSTTLIEALYNGSEAYAMPTNINDYSIYKNYPSLQDSRIKPYEDAEKLAEHIVELMAEK